MIAQFDCGPKYHWHSTAIGHKLRKTPRGKKFQEKGETEEVQSKQTRQTKLRDSFIRINQFKIDTTKGLGRTVEVAKSNQGSASQSKD